MGIFEIDSQFMEKQQIDQVLASRSIREVKGLKRVFVKGLPTKKGGIGLEIQAIVNGSDPFVLSADGTHTTLERDSPTAFSLNPSVKKVPSLKT